LGEDAGCVLKKTHKKTKAGKKRGEKTSREEKTRNGKLGGEIIITKSGTYAKGPGIIVNGKRNWDISRLRGERRAKGNKENTGK